MAGESWTDMSKDRQSWSFQREAFAQQWETYGFTPSAYLQQPNQVHLHPKCGHSTHQVPIWVLTHTPCIYLGTLAPTMFLTGCPALTMYLFGCSRTHHVLIVFASHNHLERSIGYEWEESSVSLFLSPVSSLTMRSHHNVINSTVIKPANRQITHDGNRVALRFYRSNSVLLSAGSVD